MLGWLAGPRVGAWVYNVVHIYVWPLLLLYLGLNGGPAWGAPFGLIWVAHIGADRLSGYGLKYPTFFKDTHLGRL